MLQELVLGHPKAPPTNFNSKPWNEALLVTPWHAVRKLSVWKWCQQTVRLSLTNIPKHLHNPHIYFRSSPFRISTSHSHYYFCFNHTHSSHYSSDLSVLLHKLASDSQAEDTTYGWPLTLCEHYALAGRQKTSGRRK